LGRTYPLRFPNPAKNLVISLQSSECRKAILT